LADRIPTLLPVAYVTQATLVKIIQTKFRSCTISNLEEEEALHFIITSKNLHTIFEERTPVKFLAV
jgi:hypothetical protein